MENPATWGEAERIVHDALRRAEKARQEGRCGLSAVRQVTDALREACLLLDEPYS